MVRKELIDWRNVFGLDTNRVEQEIGWLENDASEQMLGLNLHKVFLNT
jgi:hypothetical protein